MRKIWMILIVALAAISMQAQSDTITIMTYKALEPTITQTPFMSDSINIKGDAFDPIAEISKAPIIRLDNHLLSKVSVDSKGFISTQATLDTLQNTIQTYFVSLLSTSFEKAKLLIESDVPYTLFLDGQKKSQVKTYSEEMPESKTASIELIPSVNHVVSLRLLSDKGGKAKWRIKLVPEREESTIEIRLDDKEYMSAQFMLTGKSIARTSVSPSGKYATLNVYEMVGNKPIYNVILYQGTKPIAYLGSDFTRASWMPQSDKLWMTEESDTGKRLIAFDPATFETEILHPAIPDDGRFVISPDETKLIYMTQQKGPEKSDKIERVMDRYDRIGGGFRNRSFLSLFDLNTGIYRPLTYGYRSTGLHSISNDGKEVIFSTSRNTTEIPFSEGDYLVMNLETMHVDTLFASNSDLSSVMFTSDPRYLLISGTANAFDGIGKNLPAGMHVNTYDTQLFLYDRERKQPRSLTRDFDPSVGNINVLSNRFEAYFTAENQDCVSLYRVDLRSGKITQVNKSEEVVRSFGVDNYGKTLTYTGQSVNNSDRFYQVQNGRETLIHDYAGEKMQDLILGKTEDWDFTMPNGDVVQGRYYLPPNFDPNKKYPMIVYYYGGTSPTSRSFEGSYSLPMFAAQGYVVYTLNPSGTTGFGQEYASRHVNAWGKRTADEIIASVKGFCQAHPYVNADKIGCIGASYGGFMTMYLQTVTDIFAAAVSHAGISALSSYWGEGNWGIGYSTVASLGSYPWNNPQLYTEQSPLFNADKINTPLLLLHGTADTNVPVGESIQMYNAMKILGKEVEFIQVYGEDHGIFDPEKKLLWQQSTFSWFQRWLKDDPTWWDTMYPTPNL